MTMSVDVDGMTLQQFMGATEREISTALTKEAIAAAAKKDASALEGWVAKAESGGMRAELASHVVGFLQEDMAGIFAGVWTRCAELHKSAAATKGKKGVTELVALAKHEFSYSMEPAVDVLVDGVKIGSFGFGVKLACTVKALELQVRDGGVSAVRCGECEGEGKILLAGENLWQKKLLHMNLPGELRWKEPVRTGLG